MTAETTAPTTARPRERRLIVGLLVVYLALLAWLILWKLEVPWVGAGSLRELKLVPFLAAGDAGASTVREVVANVAFFVPLGAYAGLLAPTWRWRRALAVGAAVSAVLEIAQYVLAVGSSDVTDVISNSAGSLLGFGLIALSRRRVKHRTTTIMIRVCLAFTVVILVLAVAFVLSPLHYAPLGDGR